MKSGSHVYISNVVKVSSYVLIKYNNTIHVQHLYQTRGHQEETYIDPQVSVPIPQPVSNKLDTFAGNIGGVFLYTYNI